MVLARYKINVLIIIIAERHDSSISGTPALL